MKPGQRKLPLGCVLALVCLFSTGRATAQSQSVVPNRIRQTPDNSLRVSLAGNVHPLALPEFSQGPIADALPMNRILLLLKRSDAQEAALQSLLGQQQDKSSPNYHKWLSPDDFGKQFGPSDQDLETVTGWLAAQGFDGIRVSRGRNVIEFSGSAGQVHAAFGTQIENYEVNGQRYVGNSSDPQIPAVLLPVVSGIVSLHNFPRKSHLRHLGTARKGSRPEKLQPLFTFPSPNGSGSFYGVGPGDFAKIYNSLPLISAGNDGTGETIAIVGETDINPADVSAFRAMFGLSNNFSAANLILNGMDPGVTSEGEEAEADLDVQWSGAVAPGATVKLVVSASTPASAGVDLSALYIIDNNLADVMSESYGDCESDLGSAGNAFYNAMWEQAAAQGISVSVSAGDGVSAGCDNFAAPSPAFKGLAVSGIASTPFNVSVGGTDFNQVNTWSSFWSATNDGATGTSALGYIPEIPWNESCAQLGLKGCGATAPEGTVNIVAGSGGPSSVYGKPAWQIGVAGMPDDNHRDQPDVSLFASDAFNGSGYVICQSDFGKTPCSLVNAGSTFQVVGGTSAAAPAFAGIMALVNQYAAAHGGSPRQGNPNYVLYALAKRSGASCASSVAETAGCIFNDVVAGNTRYGQSVGTNSVPCAGGSLHCSSAVTGTTGVLVDPDSASTEAWTDAAGYDMASGLGSLNINNLVTNWNRVSIIATTTTLTLSPTTGIIHGENEDVSVTVNVKANTGTGIPSGDVALLATLADGSTRGLNHFTLVNGAISSAKTQNLPGGTYNVYAHYAGDGSNAPSDSAAVQVTVGKESSQTFILIPTFDSQGNQTSKNANTAAYGSNYIFRIYVSAAANANGQPTGTCPGANNVTCPTGTVTLTGNGSAVDGGTFTLNNFGYTRDIAPTLTGGTYSLVATYSGDNSYTASTSAADMFTVTPTQTQTQVYIPSLDVIGANVAVEAAVNIPIRNGVAPSGTFTFYDGSSVLPGQVTVSAFASNSAVPPSINGYLTTTLSSPGLRTITASYSGDANYAGSTSAAVEVVAEYPVTMSLTSSPETVTYGSPVTLTATVTTNRSTPTLGNGSITFNLNTSAATTTLTTDAGGNQMLTVTASAIPQTSQQIYAYFSGYPYFTNQTATATVNVNIPDFSLTTSVAPINITVGQPGTLPINVVPATKSSSPVAFSCGGNLPANYSCSVAPATVNLVNGASSMVTLTLAPAGGAATPNSIPRKHAAIFLVPHEPTSLWPRSLPSGLVALCLFCWSRKRKRTPFSLAFGLAAVVSLVIGCGGGNSFTAPVTPTSPSAPSAPPGPFVTSTTVLANSSKVAANAPVTFTATLTGQGKPSGNIGFFANGFAIGTAAVTSGSATLNTSFASPGIYFITAEYDGDSNNAGSTSSAISEGVTGTSFMVVTGQTGSLSHSLNVTVTMQ